MVEFIFVLLLIVFVIGKFSNGIRVARRVCILGLQIWQPRQRRHRKMESR